MTPTWGFDKLISGDKPCSCIKCICEAHGGNADMRYWVLTKIPLKSCKLCWFCWCGLRVLRKTNIYLVYLNTQVRKIENNREGWWFKICRINHYSIYYNNVYKWPNDISSITQNYTKEFQVISWFFLDTSKNYHSQIHSTCEFHPHYSNVTQVLIMASEIICNSLFSLTDCPC